MGEPTFCLVSCDHTVDFVQGYLRPYIFRFTLGLIEKELLTDQVDLFSHFGESRGISFLSILTKTGPENNLLHSHQLGSCVHAKLL